MSGTREVPPTKSLLIAWQLRGKSVLIVGGGNVASGRLAHVLAANAAVTLIAPREGLHPDIVSQLPQINYLDREFSGEEDLEGIDMVLTAINDVAVSSSICRMARSKRIPVNVADIPLECDFYFGSMINRGPLQIMISTNGKGPKIASIVRHRIEEAVPPEVEDAIERTGQLRAELRKRAPGVGGRIGQERMQWIIHVCEAWTLEELARLDDIMIHQLLEDGWDKGRTVLSFKELSSQSTTTSSFPVRGVHQVISSHPPSLTVICTFSAGLAVGLLLPYLRSRWK